MATSVLKIIFQTIGDDKGAKNTAREIDRVLKAVVGFGLSSLTAAGAAAVLTSAMKFSIQAAAESEVSLAKLGAVLNATGGMAGMSSEALIRLAGEMQNTSGISDELALNAESIMLSFGKISQSIFPRAMRAAQDLSVIMGGDLNGAVVQLGKALDEPVEGLAGLGRVGVRFSEEQKVTIDALMKTGQAAEAQSIILKELEGRFGGAAAAMGGTFTGSLAKVGETFGNVGEAIGTGFLPPATEAINKLEQAVRLTLLLNSVNRGYADGVSTAAERQHEFDFSMELGADASQLLGKQVEGVNIRMGELKSFGMPEYMQHVTIGAAGAGGAVGALADSVKDYYAALQALGGGQLNEIPLPTLPDAKLWNLTKKVKELADITGPTAGDQHALAQAIGDMTLNALNAKDPLFNLKLALGDIKSKDVYLRVFLQTFGATLTAKERQELATAGTTGTTGEQCFVGETPVATPGGAKRIDSLQAGDRVLVYVLETAQTVVALVAGVKHAVRDDLVEVRSARGELRCSPNHPFLTEAGWVEAQHLSPGSRLVHRRGVAVVLSVKPFPGSFEIHNLEVDHPAHTYLVAGHVVHNYKIAGGSSDVPAGMHEVGEEGNEGLYVDENGKVMVFSHPKWEMMKRMGIRPQGGFKMGSDVENPPNIVGAPLGNWDPLHYAPSPPQGPGPAAPAANAAVTAISAMSASSIARDAATIASNEETIRAMKGMIIQFRDLLTAAGGIRF